MRTPYRAADQAIPKLKAGARKEFSRTRLVMRFDEINAAYAQRNVKALYKKLEKDAQKQFEAIATISFSDAIQECVEFGIVSEKEADRIRDAFGAHKTVLGVLKSYGDVTKYVYENEVDRKRSRLLEAILADKSAGIRMNVIKDFNASRDLWIGQIVQTALDVEDAAVLAAYIAAGVETVVWMTEDDDRVCEVCDERDQQEYPIEDVPPKPHYGCRCWLELAERE